MAQLNLLLGNGEKLTQHSPITTGGGPKKFPYTFEENREALKASVKTIKTRLIDLPDAAKPRGEGVFELTLHPAFLAKSYFPADLLRYSGLRDLGSKQVLIEPRKVTNKKFEDKLLPTASLYVAGNAEAINRFDSFFEDGSISKILKRDLTEIESLNWLEDTDRLKGEIPDDNQQHKFEVVLHASSKEEDIVKAFTDYARSYSAIVQPERKIQMGGLTFLPLIGTSRALKQIANFSFLRVARLMPELRIVQPGILRESTEAAVPVLPDLPPMDTENRVAIFDGGLGVSDLDKWAKEIVLPGTEKTLGGFLQHGNEVTSTFLFGRVKDKDSKFEQPYLPVDHYRVIAPDSGTDHDLFDVLIRIRDVLQTGTYRFANLSLGPRLPIGDDDVHVWTATLDQLCALHGIFTTVAVGNDGKEDGDAARIQPPSDMVNALSVGAADISGTGWKRADYSCIGPGRSPGFVKPDGVAFGGSEAERFFAYNPLLAKVVAVSGTSYAAPLALRTAAGAFAMTTYPLSTLALKALMIHHAEQSNESRAEVGWGRFVENPNDLLECSPDSVTVIYQGQLAKGEYLRVPVPFPDAALTGQLEIKATLNIQAPTDPEHVVNYTRAGIQVSFRPRFGLQDEKTDDFFGKASQYQTEHQSREEAHKWETSLHRTKRFNQTTVLSDPVFDIRYHARQTSRSIPSESIPDMHYAMVISIRVAGMAELYNLVRQKYQVLQPVQLKVDLDLPAT